MAPTPTEVVATTCAATVAAAMPDVAAWTVVVTMAVMSVSLSLLFVVLPLSFLVSKLY